MPGLASGPAGPLPELRVRTQHWSRYGERYVGITVSPQGGRVPGLLAAGVASCRARDLCLSCGLGDDEKEGVTGKRVTSHQESGEVSVLIG